ncbi:MAG TPA: hypothetical protein VFZ24_09095 [Longimicrobiales bacterium]
MGRTIGLVIALSVALAARAQGQQGSVGVTAVIVEPVSAGPVHLDIRREAGRVSMRRAAPPGDAGTRLLRHTYVRPAPAREGERRVDRTRPGRRLRAGSRVLLEEAKAYVITTVIAANS